MIVSPDIYKAKKKKGGEYCCEGKNMDLEEKLLGKSLRRNTAGELSEFKESLINLYDYNIYMHFFQLVAYMQLSIFDTFCFPHITRSSCFMLY